MSASYDSKFLCLNGTFTSSPLGLWIVMKMLSNGLGEESFNQLNRVFDVYKTYVAPQDDSHYIEIENRVYIDTKIRVKHQYIESLRPFTPLFNISDIGPSAMKIVNDIKFKGRWLIPFEMSETRMEPFYDESRSSVIGYVEMMHSTGEHNFALIDDKIYVLELCYEDPRYSMVVMMPLNSTFSTADVCELDVFEWLGKLTGKLEEYGPAMLDLAMVKFEMQNKNDMNNILRSMSVVNIFDPRSTEDFSRISDDRGLHISSIIQVSSIKVDEIGATASSNTSATLSYKFGLDTFRLDRPFNFHIIDKIRSTILFKGAYTTPTYQKTTEFM